MSMIKSSYDVDDSEIRYLKEFDAEYGRTPDDIGFKNLEIFADN